MNIQAQRDSELSALYKKAGFVPPRRRVSEMSFQEKEYYWRSLLDDPVCEKPESRQLFLPGFQDR